MNRKMLDLQTHDEQEEHLQAPCRWGQAMRDYPLTARIWLRDSAGAWLEDVTDGAGALVANIAYCVGLHGLIGATVRIDGEVEQGHSLTTIHACCWAILEDGGTAKPI